MFLLVSCYISYATSPLNWLASKETQKVDQIREMLPKIITGGEMQLQVKQVGKIQTEKGRKYMKVEQLYLPKNPASFSASFFSKTN